jgi:hypothetical protein
MSYQNLIGLLEHVAPDALVELRQHHPDERSLLSSSRELGETDSKISAAQRAALIDLVRTSVLKLKPGADALASTIRDRMKAISRMKFFGALVASVAGGFGAVLTSLGVGNQWIAPIGAGAGMLGGVVGLVADQFERSPSGFRIAALDEYSKLLDMIGELELIRIQVERDGVLPLPEQQLEAMLEKLDKYALQISRLIRA